MFDIQNPHNLEIEKALLCAMYLDQDILSLTNCKTDWFYSKDHRDIFDAMILLQKEWKVIDAITIHDTSQVSQDYVYEVSIEIMTGAWWKEYEDILLELYMKRKLLKTSQDIQLYIKDKTSDEILMKIKNILNSMDNRDTWISWYDLLIETLEDITSKQTNICNYWYWLLDKYLWWYKEWQLIVIAGRPWFGKTALIIELMQKILQQDKRATIYSLEMSNTEMIKRLLSNWTDIPTQLLSKEENQQQIAERAEPKSDILKKAMFYDKIFDFNSLERSIRRGAIVQWHNVVFIDHIWLIKSNIKVMNRTQEIWYMTSSLKTLAKELWISIVILSQLNRNVEKRNDEPELSDLRDSGNIEQDADIVMMIHRDKTDDWHYDNNIFDLLIRKNRSWNLARIAMWSDLSKMRITELPLKTKRW